MKSVVISLNEDVEEEVSETSLCDAKIQTMQDDLMLPAPVADICRSGDMLTSI